MTVVERFGEIRKISQYLESRHGLSHECEDLLDAADAIEATLRPLLLLPRRKIERGQERSSRRAEPMEVREALARIREIGYQIENDHDLTDTCEELLDAAGTIEDAFRSIGLVPS